MNAKNNQIRGLYAIVDDSIEGDLVERARLFLEGGAKILQLRQKKASAETVIQTAQKILTLKNSHSFLFFVNDDPKIALFAAADGVHLGQDDMPVAEARKILGKGRLIGKSSHSLVEAQDALAEEIDYVALGAIYPTGTKPPGHPTVGISVLKEVVAMSPIPVVAIGGINRTNVKTVLEAGASAFALISALSRTPDILDETRYYASLAK